MIDCALLSYAELKGIRMHKVELLAPAGSMDAFRGALNAGADAIYLAGQKFGARAYADNFTEEELETAIRTAHLYGVKVYLTVNTLTRQGEMDELTAFVRELYKKGLDGVIVQDTGVMRRLRKACPGLLLHASTQLSVTTKEAVRYLKRLGVCRIVPARELSLEEIRLLKNEGIEIEAFIHGAMCYSYSGRCLMSSFLGGRSGNRGRCAGTCRLPYTILDSDGRTALSDKDCYPLSMKDMCVLDILPELLDSGIDSFKIEGRMKKPEYAAGTTAIYRKYIDRFYTWDAAGRKEPWKIDSKDRQHLLSLYIRKELGCGYYKKRNGADMVTLSQSCYAGADGQMLADIKKKYLELDRKMSVRAKAFFIQGKPATLELTIPEKPGLTVRVTGDTVMPAINQPVTGESLRERLRKTGGTLFRLEKVTVLTDGASFLPASSLNALRRNALSELADRLLRQNTAGGENAAEEAAPSAVLPADGCSPEETERGAGAAGTRCVTSAGPSGLWIMVSTIRQLSEVCRQVLEERSPGRTDARIEAAENGKQGKIAAVLLDTPLTDLLVLELSEAGRNYPAGAGNSSALPAGTCRGGISGHLRALQEEQGVPVLSALPYIFRESDRPWMEQAYRLFQDKVQGFFLRNLEELEFFREKDYDGRVIVDSPLYHWNRDAQETVLSYADGAVLPLELNRTELLETFGDTLASRDLLFSYGRVPLMMTANCVRKTAGCCAGTNAAPAYLKDRMGKCFPVRCECSHCMNIIYNSVPVSLHNYSTDPAFKRTGRKLLCFTDEPVSLLRGVIRAYEKLLDENCSPNTRGETAREVTELLGRDGFTAGHYRKGAI